MVERFEVIIPSLTKNKPRRAFVYLPVGYDGERRFPVMYMFDGQNLFEDEEATFGKSWGLADYLDYTRTPLIIASVECNHEGNRRLEEYSPVDFDMDGEHIKGRGKKYMDWLVKVFKPYIDRRYLTLPKREHTAIGGSSMGGLMALYAVAKYNRTFSRSASLSPSLWTGGEEVLPFLKNGRFSQNTLIYADYGSKEFSNHPAQRKAFADTVQYLISRGVCITSRIVKGGTHCEACWQKSIPFFMNALGFLPEDEQED